MYISASGVFASDFKAPFDADHIMHMCFYLCVLYVCTIFMYEYIYIYICTCTSVHEGYKQTTSKHLAMVAILYRYVYIYTPIYNMYIWIRIYVCVNVHQCMRVIRNRRQSALQWWPYHINTYIYTPIYNMYIWVQIDICTLTSVHEGYPQMMSKHLAMVTVLCICVYIYMYYIYV